MKGLDDIEWLLIAVLVAGAVVLALYAIRIVP